METKIDQNFTRYLKVMKTNKDKFLNDDRADGLSNDFISLKKISMLNNNNADTDPFFRLQLSSHTRPRLKPVINNNKRSPMIIKFSKPLEDIQVKLRCSKSEESLINIFKPRRSKLRIKVVSLPPLARLPLNNNQCELTPKFKPCPEDEQKPTKTIKFFDKIKRKTNTRSLNRIQKKDLANITFSEKLNNVFKND